MKSIIMPNDALQYTTANPYSPVLEVKGNTLVVISGQASINSEGKVIGKTIEEQTIATLNNCEKVLKAAGCTFADVIKVTAYMKDLNDWARFNVEYSKIMKKPYPVRTAIQVGLLDHLLIEIEMWAVKE